MVSKGINVPAPTSIQEKYYTKASMEGDIKRKFYNRGALPVRGQVNSGESVQAQNDYPRGIIVPRIRTRFPPFTYPP